MRSLPRARRGVFSAGCGAAGDLVGLWNQTWDQPQQWIRLLDVVLVGAATVFVSAVRVRREQRMARVTAIAATAQRATGVAGRPSLRGLTESSFTTFAGWPKGKVAPGP